MGKTSGRVPGQTVSYPLRWPVWLAEEAAEAASARAMSVATWLREAALEKLERDGKKGRGARPARTANEEEGAN